MVMQGYQEGEPTFVLYAVISPRALKRIMYCTAKAVKF